MRQYLAQCRAPQSRFECEAQAIASLSHRHTCTLCERTDWVMRCWDGGPVVDTNSPPSHHHPHRLCTTICPPEMQLRPDRMFVNDTTLHPVSSSSGDGRGAASVDLIEPDRRPPGR